MTRAVDTRRVYAFENRLIVALKRSDTPIHKLRRFARRVCKDWKLDTPDIAAGRGMRSLGQFCSYYSARERKIVLARHHRNHIVVLHELAHAMGFDVHGKGFQNRYADLLMRYA